MKKIFDFIKNKSLIIISIAIIIFNFCIDFQPNIKTSTGFKLICYILVTIMVFIDMKFKNRKETNEEVKNKNRKRLLIFILIVYSLFLIELLLLDGTYRRKGMNIKLFSKEHFDLYSNFIPFATIAEFFQRIVDGTINNDIVITNILGNIIAFAPYGILIPLIYDKRLNLWKFSLLMILIVLVIESIQFITFVGAFDIDDLILNVFGAALAFKVIKIPFVKKIINKVLE